MNIIQHKQKWTHTHTYTCRFVFLSWTVHWLLFISNNFYSLLCWNSSWTKSRWLHLSSWTTHAATKTLHLLREHKYLLFHQQDLLWFGEKSFILHKGHAHSREISKLQKQTKRRKKSIAFERAPSANWVNFRFLCEVSDAKLTTNTNTQFHRERERHSALTMNSLDPEVLMLETWVCVLLLTFTQVMSWAPPSLFLQTTNH